jgi:hypothetical protein
MATIPQTRATMTFLLICFLLLVDWMHAVTRTNHPNRGGRHCPSGLSIPDSFGETGKVEPSMRRPIRVKRRPPGRAVAKVH